MSSGCSSSPPAWLAIRQRAIRMPCSVLAGSPPEGFTLIEALVALLVLVIVLTVVMQTQVTTLNMEQAARATQQVRLEAERIFTEVHLGNTRSNIVDTAPVECSVGVTILPGADGEDSTDFLQWDISAQDRASLKLTLITRPCD